MRRRTRILILFPEKPGGRILILISNVSCLLRKPGPAAGSCTARWDIWRKTARTAVYSTILYRLLAGWVGRWGGTAARPAPVSAQICIHPSPVHRPAIFKYNINCSWNGFAGYGWVTLLPLVFFSFHYYRCDNLMHEDLTVFLLFIHYCLLPTLRLAQLFQYWKENQ